LPIILGIDTSAKTASAAICAEGKIIAQTQLNTRLTHSQTALPMVQALLDCAMLTMEDIDCFAVSSGPGSFTGLRIGIAAVKAICFTSKKPCAGVSTLEALARNLTGIDGIVCAAMDARCRQVYTALFEISGNGTVFRRLSEDAAISVEELELQLKSVGKKITLVGDGAELCYQFMKEHISELVLAAPLMINQTGFGVCMAAQAAIEKGETVEAGELMPKYLRLPQAERERMAKLKEKQ